MSGRRRPQVAKHPRPLYVQSFDAVPLTCGHSAIGNPEIDYPRRKWWCDTCRKFKSRKSGGST